MKPKLNPRLIKRNKALLYILAGLSILFYFIAFVRMGQ
jgi:hypothetical protein